MRIEIKGYSTVACRGVEIAVAPELLQDVWAGSQEPEALEREVLRRYHSRVRNSRKSKIERIIYRK